MTTERSVVDATARLASLEAGGEVLVSSEAAKHAGLDTSVLDGRTVEVRGRAATMDVYAVGAHVPRRA